jgi:hypothetical protein
MSGASKGFLMLELAFCIALSILTIKALGISLHNLSRSYRALVETTARQRSIKNAQELVRWHLGSQSGLSQFQLEFNSTLLKRTVSVNCQEVSSSIAGQCQATCTFRTEANNQRSMRIYAPC